MSDYSSILTAAIQFPASERVRLIEEIEDTLMDDGGDLPPLSAEWLAEIDRRSAAIDAGTATLVDWEIVRADLFRRVGLDRGA